MVRKFNGKEATASLNARVHQYEIAGRAAPTPKNPVPQIFKMKLFAKNQVLARSKFWYFMKKINRAKKSGGEILREVELFEKHPTKVNNYGIWLRCALGVACLWCFCPCILPVESGCAPNGIFGCSHHSSSHPASTVQGLVHC